MSEEFLKKPNATRIKPNNRFAYAFSRATILLLLCTALSLFAPLWWAAELFSHFAWHYMLLAATFAIFLLFYRKVFFFIIATLVFAFNLYQVYPLYVQSDAPNTASTQATIADEVKILQYNLMWDSSKKENTLDWLLDQKKDDVDIMVFQEVSEEWREVLRPLLIHFNHVVTTSNESKRDLMVLSDLTLIRSKKELIGEKEILNLDVITNNHVLPFSLIALHAPSPLGDERALERDVILQRTTDIAGMKQPSDNIIIVGDFNSSPFSPAFKHMLRDGNLKDSWRGFGYNGTWPHFLPSEFGISIDHLLTSQNVMTIDKEVVRRQLGSDHYPIITTLNIKKP